MVNVGYGDAGPRAAGDFHFAAIAMSEMGQNRRGSSGENSGDRVGRESSYLNLDDGLGQHKA